MERLRLSERIRIARLAADRLRRSAISRAMQTPPLRWHFGLGGPEQLLIVPQELRTTDASFWDEVELGQYGLAGTVALAGDSSPLRIRPPNDAWARALNGFEWLRHMDAAGHHEARDTARRLAREWAQLNRGGSGIAWEPAVAARRIMSWLSHSNLLLEGADAATYAAITESLGSQIVRLSATWRNSPDGYPRLLALTALVLAHLCIARHEPQLAEAEAAFTAELGRQILPDGGHVSRNPGVLVELMLDLLPLSQCFAARGRTAPPALVATMQNMLAMLKFMRLGDGMLARFNGMGVASPAGLATVLAYDDRAGIALQHAKASGYVRLQCGGSIVIMDAGRPPPLEAAGEAHAGCLSFEFSAGTRAIFVNGGAPSPANDDWRSTARATASHNTLCLAEKSSSRLVRDRLLEDLVGAPPIRLPNKVAADLEEHGGALEVTTEHDGYVRRFGLAHRRTLVLNATGKRLLGIDRLDGERGNLRLKQDLPLSIHFHLHPDVVCRRAQTANAAEISLPDGETWRLSVEGAQLTMEDSTYFADSAGPRSTLQVVARCTTAGQTEVRWVMESLG